MIFNKIIDAILLGKFRFTSHGFEEMSNDNLEENDILFSTARGEVIEDYPTLKPFPACLVQPIFQMKRNGVRILRSVKNE